MARTFEEWADVARVTDDPAGDFISDWHRAGPQPPPINTYSDLSRWLRDQGACFEALAASKQAWRRFQAWKRRNL
jgi:hypothetical protein